MTDSENRRFEIYCPCCLAAGIKRKLMEVDKSAVGIIYPYCKGCKRNVLVKLPDMAGDFRHHSGSANHRK